MRDLSEKPRLMPVCVMRAVWLALVEAIEAATAAIQRSNAGMQMELSAVMSAQTCGAADLS